MKRSSLRSINSSRFTRTGPCTCERNPSVWYSGENSMPLRPERSEASTSSLLVPMLETMPIPVTTTRRMALPSESVGGGEQSHLQVLACIDIATVDLHRGVGDTHHQLAQDHALHADAVGNFPCEIGRASCR